MYEKNTYFQPFAFVMQAIKVTNFGSSSALVLVDKFCYGVFFFFNLFYFWLRWVFVTARGLSLVVASGGYSSLQCVSFSLRWLLLLRSTGSRRVGFSSCGTWASVVVAQIRHSQRKSSPSCTPGSSGQGSRHSQTTPISTGTQVVCLYFSL